MGQEASHIFDQQAIRLSNELAVTTFVSDRARVELLEQRGIMKYAHLTVEEHRQVLAAAGYTDVQVFEDYDEGWLCATGRRPVQRAALRSSAARTVRRA